MRQRADVRPLNETPDFKRAGGDTVCTTCRKCYYDHPQHRFTDTPDDPARTLFLHRLCDGTFVKL